MKNSIKKLVMGLLMASGMALVMFPTSRINRLPAILTLEDLSWIEFCKARGYDFHDESGETVNEYLDTWVGSAEEEASLSPIYSEV